MRGKFLFLTLLAALLFAASGKTQQQDKYIVAAHYYAWYGGSINPHWPDGVAHRPWLGYYSSASPDIVRRQIDLATQYGVDVFAVGWTGIDSASEKKFRAGFLHAPNLNKIRFCMVYDSLGRLRGERSQPLYFDFNDPSVRDTFVADLAHLAKNYFNHPSY